jgi:hypothetical protein
VQIVLEALYSETHVNEAKIAVNRAMVLAHAEKVVLFVRVAEGWYRQKMRGGQQGFLGDQR